jgi:hypothetical protein
MAKHRKVCTEDEIRRLLIDDEDDGLDEISVDEDQGEDEDEREETEEVYRMVDVLVQDEVGNRLYGSPFFLLL